jgi:hypothetical protein
MPAYSEERVARTAANLVWRSLDCLLERGESSRQLEFSAFTTAYHDLRAAPSAPFAVPPMDVLLGLYSNRSTGAGTTILIYPDRLEICDTSGIHPVRFRDIAAVTVRMDGEVNGDKLAVKELGLRMNNGEALLIPVDGGSVGESGEPTTRDAWTFHSFVHRMIDFHRRNDARNASP